MRAKKIKVICGVGFNRIHEGHKFFLREAKKLGDELIVMISHDNLNRRKNGKKAVPALRRKKVVEALGIADKVFVGDSKDRVKIIRKEMPDIIALGYDQSMPELKDMERIKITIIGKKRCDWPGDDPLMRKYHDEEWGVPVHDDRHLFELLILEGAQAGLSWETILKRRATYRIAFHNFDIEKVANYGPEKIADLLQDEGIIRNRLKVNAAVKNARAVLEIQREFGSFDAYLWSYVPDGTPLQPDRPSLADIPALAPESQALSKDLKKRGMTFVGPTIIYAFMQSAGLVNDHQVSCFRHEPVKLLSKS
ncbi:MAG: DNA-3-methyladenine glycosylase I [Chloroflexi bacterium]|nr:DNA-3-methyladenine glycosylase I [Chloroflexota bacterium]